MRLFSFLWHCPPHWHCPHCLGGRHRFVGLCSLLLGRLPSSCTPNPSSSSTSSPLLYSAAPGKQRESPQDGKPYSRVLLVWGLEWGPDPPSPAWTCALSPCPILGRPHCPAKPVLSVPGEGLSEVRSGHEPATPWRRRAVCPIPSVSCPLSSPHAHSATLPQSAGLATVRLEGVSCGGLCEGLEGLTRVCSGYPQVALFPPKICSLSGEMHKMLRPYLSLVCLGD